MRVGQFSLMCDGEGAGNAGQQPAADPGQSAAYWEGEAKKAFEARQRAKAEADELRTKVDALKGIDPEEYKTLKAAHEQAEQERAKKAGDFETALKKQAEKHQTELAAAQQEKSDFETRWRKTVIGRAFADAVDLFGPAGKTIYLPNDAERIFGDHVRLNDDGAVVVLDHDGEVILDGKTGKPATFAAAMAEYIDGLPDKQYRLRGSGKTGSGSAGGSNNSASSDGPIDASQLTPEQRRDPKIIAALKRQRPRSGMVFGTAWNK